MRGAMVVVKPDHQYTGARERPAGLSGNSGFANTPEGKEVIGEIPLYICGASP